MINVVVAFLWVVIGLCILIPMCVIVGFLFPYIDAWLDWLCEEISRIKGRGASDPEVPQQISDTMLFWGGPLDGHSETPEEGWPAPSGYKKPDLFGGFYLYERDRVTEEGVHIYLYQGWEGRGSHEN